METNSTINSTPGPLKLMPLTLPCICISSKYKPRRARSLSLITRSLQTSLSLTPPPSARPIGSPDARFLFFKRGGGGPLAPLGPQMGSHDVVLLFQFAPEQQKGGQFSMCICMGLSPHFFA